MKDFNQASVFSFTSADQRLTKAMTALNTCTHSYTKHEHRFLFY